MRSKTAVLAVCSVALVAAMGIPPAYSYFTDSSTANGGLTVSVEPSTDVREWYTNNTKHVVISNAADASAAVYVRARVFSSLDAQVSGSAWTGPDADGWYTFNGVLDPGQETSGENELTVGITFPPVQSDTQPDGAVYGDNYNVIVVYESTPVQYDAAGNAYADWSFVLDSGN